jgi:hypothetical protein
MSNFSQAFYVLTQLDAEGFSTNVENKVKRWRYRVPGEMFTVSPHIKTFMWYNSFMKVWQSHELATGMNLAVGRTPADIKHNTKALFQQYGEGKVFGLLTAAGAVNVHEEISFSEALNRMNLFAKREFRKEQKRQTKRN